MRHSPWLAGLLSGCLLGLTTIAHGPFAHGQAAIFFGFLPLWSYWLRESDPRRIFLAGWICQLTLTLIAFHWIAHTVNEFSHLGLPLSVLVLLLYCAVGNLQFPLAGLAWHGLFGARARHSAASLAGLAVLTAIGERVGTMVFHWNFGYAWLYLGLPGAQLADVTGFRFLCTAAICLNAFALAAWRARGTRGGALALAGGLATFAALNGLGAWRLAALPAPDAVARVLLVQPALGNRDKEAADRTEEARIATLQKHFALTQKALASLAAPPDVTVWPENAFPGFIADTALKFGTGPVLAKFLVEHRLRLLTGGYGMNARGQTTNGLFALEANGTWIQPAYEKRILLPFGEYVPGADTFPALKRWLPDVRDYGRGAGPVVLQLAGIRFGAEICYEGLFDSIARELADAGAQLLVNITNDSWYGDWLEPWQHLYITLAKAIETRRPLVRDTNSGVSTVILADGTILEQSPMGAEWFRLYEVPYRREPERTPFQRWGHWFDTAFLALALLAACALTPGRWRGATPRSAG